LCAVEERRRRGLAIIGYAAAARYHAAILRDDPNEKAGALAYLRGEGVVATERMIAILLPGFSP
jgi:hypothetical protein